MIYAADLHNSARLLRVITPAPLEQTAMERPIPVHLGSARRVRFTLRSKAFGKETKVSATLYSPHGSMLEIEIKDGEIDTGILKRIDITSSMSAANTAKKAGLNG